LDVNNSDNKSCRSARFVFGSNSLSSFVCHGCPSSPPNVDVDVDVDVDADISSDDNDDTCRSSNDVEERLLQQHEYENDKKLVENGHDEHHNTAAQKVAAANHYNSDSDSDNDNDNTYDSITAMHYDNNDNDNDNDNDNNNDSISALPRIEEESEEQMEQDNDDDDNDDEHDEEGNNDIDNDDDNDNEDHNDNNDLDRIVAAVIAKDEKGNDGDALSSSSRSNVSLSSPATATTTTATATATATATSANNVSPMVDIGTLIISYDDTLDDVHDKLELMGWTIDPYGQIYMMPTIGYHDLESNPNGRNTEYFLDEKSFRRYLRDTYGWQEHNRAINYQCNKAPVYCNIHNNISSTPASLLARLAFVKEERKIDGDQREKNKKQQQQQQHLSPCFP